MRMALPALSPENDVREKRDIVIPRDRLPARAAPRPAGHHRLARLKTKNDDIEKTPDKKPDAEEKKIYHTDSIPRLPIHFTLTHASNRSEHQKIQRKNRPKIRGGPSRYHLKETPSPTPSAP